jgi:anti-sigma-K factor RskA
LEAGSIYEFWLIEGDTPMAAGLFEVNEEGKAILQVSQAVTSEAYDAIGVSIEPEAGSVQPTGDIVMLGGLD